MKRLAILLWVAILATSCNAQDKNNTDIAKALQPTDSIFPKGNWTVNKELDENGNIIRYDSIYSWSSGNLKEFSNKDADSILNEMKARMQLSFSDFDDFNFSGFASHDSIMKQLFSYDLFSNRMPFNFKNLDSIKLQIQQMHQQFFNNQRYIIPPIIEDTEPEKKRL